MVINGKTIDVNGKGTVQFWLLATASCLALICLVLSMFTGAVQATGVVSSAPATALPVSPVSAPTPVMTARKTGGTTPSSLLKGVASWYGSVFDGRLTASGEKFDMYAMTACHPTLPFGTLVRVIDLANRRSVVVRITDRGDLLNKRIIDLSYAAAEKLDMTKRGLARVKLEIIALGPSPAHDR